MKNKKAVKSAKKEEVRIVAGGRYRADSTMGNLFELLSKGKPVGPVELKKACASGTALSGRLSALKRDGKKWNTWVIEDLGHNRTRMRLLPGYQAKLSRPRPKHEGSAKKASTSAKKAGKGGAVKSGKKSGSGRKWKDED